MSPTPLLLLAAVAMLLSTACVWAQPYSPDERTLLLDHLDETFTPDGKTCTRPAVIQRTGDFTGGRPRAGTEFVQGKFGNALQFHGLTDMQYPSAGNINLAAGQVEFWVALDFDATEQIKNPGLLSNQLFFTVVGPARTRMCIYSTLSQTCVAVFDASGQLACYAGARAFWKKGEWHHLQVRWGRSLELWCDGTMAASQDWQGLFGPLGVKPDELRIVCGSVIGWSGVESEFAMDELRILGPGGEQVPDYPTMTVCRIKPPNIDGTIDEAEWAGAARTTGFIAINEYTLAEEQTIVHAGFDDEALYLAYECLNPHGREYIARLRDHDSGVYMEDSVDFICRPDPDGFPYYHFICNAIGTVYDATTDPTRQTRVDLDYNPACVFKTSQTPERWMMECRIPFSELGGRGTPIDGERWRVNFCRDGESLNLYSSWAYAAGNFHTVANFGEIVFSNSDRAIRVGPLGDLAMGQVDANLALTGFLFDPIVVVTAKLVGADAKTIAEQENRLADYRAVAFKAPPLVTGAYNLTLRAATADTNMYYQRLPFSVMKAYDISVEGYPYEGRLWVTSNVAGLTAPPEGLIARSRLMQGEQVVAECRADGFTQGIGSASIPIDDLPPGMYMVKSEALGPDGAVLASAEAEYEQFARPTWWKSRAGLDNTVPYPWEPVRCDGQTITVWGREYQCGDGSLPRQVVNQGEQMLAAPISLMLSSGAQTTDLAGLRALDAAAPDDASVRHSRGSVDKLDVRLMCTTEFDGMQRYDLTLTPREATEVSNLLLEIPIKSEYATFLCPSNGKSSPALEVPAEGWQSAFIPQVWVGNDDIGFAWIAESDEFWRPHDDMALEVRPEGERTSIRCNMVRQPLKLDKPVTITFALMATPVKDAHAGDPFWVRFGSGVGSPMCQELCRYPAAGNVDLKQGTLELWFAPLEALGGTWRQIASINGPTGRLDLYYLPAAEQQLAVLLTNGQQKLSSAARGFELKPDEFAHVAVTWGEQIELFLNGKRHFSLDGSLPREWADQPAKFGIRLGCPTDYTGYTNIAVDEFRVSNVIRYQGESYTVPTEPFTPDAQTLLLDHFEESFRPDGEDAETRAEVISGQSNELGGIPSLGCEFIEAGKFGSGLRIAMLDPMTREQAMERWGFNAKLHWFWAEKDGTKYGWPSPLFTEPEIEGLRQTIAEDTALGIRPSTYMGYPAVGSPSPLSRQFGYEWSRRPMSTQPSEPPKGHYFWDVCAHSGYADYMAAGAQWMLDDLGFYGLYTDGCAQAYPCKNTHHGCGWVDEAGQVHSTWPVFATREMLKRMYKLIHAKHEDGYLVNHVSFNTLIPTMSFSDIVYSGEHEQYENLLRFRVRWQGKQWGYWSVLLGGDAHIYEPLHMTWCLLHGVSVWPQGWTDRNDASRKTSNLWQTYDRFGYRDAQWIPYFRAEKLVSNADAEQVKTSLYLIQGERALLVVANLTPEVVQARVHVDLEAMGLKGTVVRNALTDEALPYADGAISLRLRPSTFVLVWVE